MKYQSVTSHFQNGGGRDRPVFEEKTRTGENLGRRRPTAAGIDWVHEIKHDGYRILVRRDGPAVPLYSRNAFDWTVRLSAIAAAAELIKAKSFTIDRERLCWDLTACHASRSCPAVRPLEPRSFTPST
jgi:ATP-dependent DNA ligase